MVKTIRVLLMLRRAGFEFDYAAQTDRHYMLTRGALTIPVPRVEILDGLMAADILKKAGLLLTFVFTLAGLSSALPRAERGDLRESRAPIVRSLR